MWWQDDAAWYTGSVSRYDAHSGRHLVEYDDGDEEEVDLAAEKYKVLPGGFKVPIGARKRLFAW